MNKPLDFLIVGFGLSGALLAWELARRGSRILIVDSGDVNASQVAAGLINPLTGFRLAKTEAVDELLPVAKDFYRQLTDTLGRPFLVEKPMHRLLRSDMEIAYCRKRLKDDVYRPYMRKLYLTPAFREKEKGYLEQRQTGYLLTRPLLGAMREFLRSRQAYRQATFDYRELRLNSLPGWQDTEPRQVIFCEGFRMRENPWFSWLPLQPVKGEILTLSHCLDIPDRILNDGHWLIPIGQNEVRIGATFDREDITLRSTLAAQKELAEAGERFFAGLQDAELIAQEAGIRPCTADRQPFIGSHPRHPYLHVFNGFGTKGSLSIPWHCRRFADYLLRGKDLPEHCDIKRYEKTHFPG